MVTQVFEMRIGMAVDRDAANGNPLLDQRLCDQDGESPPTGDQPDRLAAPRRRDPPG
jgi:hypothetical protein